MDADTTQDGPRSKAELIERITQSWQALEQVIGRLSDAQMTVPTDENGWSVKDHLAHISAWEQALVALLEGRAEVSGFGAMLVEEAEEMDDTNARLYHVHRHETLDEVRTAFHTSHQQVLAILESMTEEDLLKPYSHYQPNSTPLGAQPIVAWVNGNTWGHYTEHHVWIERLVNG